MADSKKKTTFHVLSHFHWDREWYQPYEGYRFRLVRAIDELLNIMERDPSYRFFHMDGQTIVLQDYLEIRPQNRERLEKLIREGRILIGPWYVMPDEFLVSGESLVRNLQKGTGICRRYGVEPMHCYYVIDLFGHNTQSPQIAQGFGLPRAMLFRGIGDYPKDTFTWQAADGSTVMCSKLDSNYCYSTFFFAAREPFDGGDIRTEEMLQRVRKYADYAKSLAVCNDVPSFDGCDHAEPEPMTPTMLKQINEAFDDVEFVHSTLEEYYRCVEAQQPALETVRGALYNSGREGGNNFLLQNTLSSCLPLRQQNEQCEQLLTRVCEPLDVFTALLCPAPKGRLQYAAIPRSDFFARAWDLLLQNHPHDSICGCSIGAVHQDNDTRYRHVQQIGESVLEDIWLQLAQSCKTDANGADGAFILYNPSSEAIQGQTVFTLRAPIGLDTRFTLFDPDGEKVPFQILGEKIITHPLAKKLELVKFVADRELTICAELHLPALSLAVYTYRHAAPVLADPVYNGTPVIRFSAPEGSMQVAPLCFDNGPLRVQVCDNGTLQVTDKATDTVYEGLLRLEDGDDDGDGYRYIRPPYGKVELSSHADITLVADGPMAAQIRIATTIRGQTATHTVTVRKGQTRLDIRTDMNNTQEGHRLRALLPLPYTVTEYYTKLPYDMARWQVRVPNNVGAADIDTGVTPMQGALLLQSGKASFAVYTKGLYEIQMYGEKAALTLMRSVCAEVGGQRATYANLLRELYMEYALDFAAETTPSEAYRRAEQFQSGVCAYAEAVHDGVLSGVQTPIRLTDESGSLVLCAVQPDCALPDGDKAVAVRILNVSEKEAQGALRLQGYDGKVWKSRLDGADRTEAEVKNGEVLVRLNAKQIGTYWFAVERAK